MNGPGRDDGGPESSGFSLRSLPELLRLIRRKIEQANKSFRIGQINSPSMSLVSFTFLEFSWSQSLWSVEEWWKAEVKV